MDRRFWKSIFSSLKIILNGILQLFESEFQFYIEFVLI